MLYDYATVSDSNRSKGVNQNCSTRRGEWASTVKRYETQNENAIFRPIHLHIDEEFTIWRNQYASASGIGYHIEIIFNTNTHFIAKRTVFNKIADPKPSWTKNNYSPNVFSARSDQPSHFVLQKTNYSPFFKGKTIPFHIFKRAKLLYLKY